MSFATPSARQRLADFDATNPTPEQCRTPAYAELKAAAEFEAEVELRTNPTVMRAKAESLDADAVGHELDAGGYERGAQARRDCGNDHGAAEWGDMASASRRCAINCRREANLLRASAARLIERVAA